VADVHHSLSSSEKCEPNLIPMLDLVLQLIMFFIVCVSFKAQDYNSKDVQLPVAQSARTLERSGDDPVFLNMNEKGELLVVGRDPLKTQSEIKGYLLREHDFAERLAKERGDKKIRTVIVIRAHRGVDWGQGYQLLHLCKDAGFTKLQLRAVQKAGG
jgi:biopolymer transport protein ExbD